MVTRLIQITDLHIGNEEEKPFGVDVRKNFKLILDELKSEHFDKIILTGDLCYREPDESILHWIKEELEQLTKDYLIISGNHDSNRLINKIFFEKESDELFYIHKFNAREVIFLDTSKTNVDDEQMVWLSKELPETSDYQVIFMHHPADICDVPHMDAKHYLKNYKELKSLLEKYPYPIYIFCGHYHIQKSIHYQNINIFISPSTFFQIDDRFLEFKIASYDIGYRVIELHDNNIHTSVKYLNCY